MTDLVLHQSGTVAVTVPNEKRELLKRTFLDCTWSKRMFTCDAYRAAVPCPALPQLEGK